jgi:hypothetical protein
MIKLIYPEAKPKIKQTEKGEKIFCAVRKRWFDITPEEWVRQNFLLYLHFHLGFAYATIAVEKQITLAQLKKRFDIVVYANSKPFMLIECKEMNVKLSDHTITQVLQYNSIVQAAYLVITNGTYCHAFIKVDNEFYETNELPTAQ